MAVKPLKLCIELKFSGKIALFFLIYKAKIFRRMPTEKEIDAFIDKHLQVTHKTPNKA